MGKYDLGTSLFWFALSIVIIFYSRRLGLGRFNHFGPGFIFYWMGIILGVLAIILFLKTMKHKKGMPSEKGQREIFQGVNWFKIVGVVFSLTFYGMIYEKLGYLVSTFLFMSFLLYSIGSKRWYVGVGVALLTSILSYAFFELFLQTKLPKGIFGI